MRAAQLLGPGDIRVVDVPGPLAPGPGEVLLRVAIVGICGSDLHTFRYGDIGDVTVGGPFIPGHEFSAEVLAVGEEARDGPGESLIAGRRVAVDPAASCGCCDMCRVGNPNLCRDLRFAGLWPEDGALRERAIFPARSCYPLPESLSMEEGALLEPLGVAIHAVDLAKVRAGQSVAVLGCGPIGLLIARLCRLAGAGDIFASDPVPERLRAAQRWGVDKVIDPRDSDPVETIRSLTGSRGVEVVFEAAWAGETAEQAVEIADSGGRVIFIGIPRDDTLSFRHSAARRKGLTLLMCRRMRHAYPRAIALALSRVIDLKPLVSHRFPLDRCAEAFVLNADYRDGAMKVIIEVA